MLASARMAIAEAFPVFSTVIGSLCALAVASAHPPTPPPTESLKLDIWYRCMTPDGFARIIKKPDPGCLTAKPFIRSPKEREAPQPPETRDAQAASSPTGS